MKEDKSNLSKEEQELLRYAKASICVAGYVQGEKATNLISVIERLDCLLYEEKKNAKKLFASLKAARPCSQCKRTEDMTCDQFGNKKARTRWFDCKNRLRNHFVWYNKAEHSNKSSNARYLHNGKKEASK